MDVSLPEQFLQRGEPTQSSAGGFNVVADRCTMSIENMCARKKNQTNGGTSHFDASFCITHSIGKQASSLPNHKQL